MALRRFHCDDLAADHVTLDAEQAGHARKSLRLEVGHAVELFDGAGTTAVGRITELSRRMVVSVTERNNVAPPQPTIDIAAAIPKGDRAGVLIEAAAQLGVDRIIPLVTDRSVVEPGKNKQQRFDRIAVEAAKQCGRAWLMTIAPPTKLDALLAAADHDLKLLCDTPAAADVQELQDAGRGRPTLSGVDRVLVLVGPEGGWTDEERAAALAADYRPWSFNANVLRVETAALAAAAILRS